MQTIFTFSRFVFISHFRSLSKNISEKLSTKHIVFSSENIQPHSNIPKEREEICKMKIAPNGSQLVSQTKLQQQRKHSRQGEEASRGGRRKENSKNFCVMVEKNYFAFLVCGKSTQQRDDEVELEEEES